MRTFSRDWYMFTGGFIWAFACGALLACIVFSWTFSRALNKPEEQKCADPIVEMAEYTTVVHSLDRCNWRLDEEQRDNFQMKDAVDHWDYISRITNTVDEEINCMLLIEKATRDFREQCEDEIYICEAVRADECWCPGDPAER